MKKRFDIIIVGSGASGGAAAYSLADAGFRVAVLEKGRLIRREEFSKDEIAYCRRDIVTPSLFGEFHTIEQYERGEWTETPTYESGWSFWNGNIVGGSSNFMSGMFHRMHPDDFRLLSAYGTIDGANIVDWPIDYDELEPYYTLAEELAGISGRAQLHPHLGHRSSRDFPQPPTRENSVTALFDRSCRELGITPLITPRAILSQDRGERRSCYYSNYCGSYGCSSGAKGSSREAFLIPALATGNLSLLSNTHVKKILSNRTRVTGVIAVDTLTMKEFELEADIVIVAAQAHESVRLLLNSANRYHPDGLANSSGELGKNLIFSSGGAGQGVLHREDFDAKEFDAFMQRGLFVNRSILDWYIRSDWLGKKSKGGLVEFMFEHQNIIARAIKTAGSEEKLLWGEALGKKLKDRFFDTKTVRYEIFNDWLPTDACFITLDTGRRDRYGMNVGKMRLYQHPHDMKIAKETAKQCEQLLAEMGARDISSSISTLPPQNLIAGGCRFGDDPKRSCLDRNCRSHDLANLYVVDASFIPTGGSVPYTWTLYANALRVADSIIKNC